MKTRTIVVSVVVGALGVLAFLFAFNRWEKMEASDLGADREPRPLAAPAPAPRAEPGPLPQPAAPPDSRGEKLRVLRAEREVRPRAAPAPAPRAGPAPPQGDAFATVDRILEKMELGNIAFNAPPAINLGDTATIQLLLGLATTTEELKKMIEAAGAKEGARIRVSNRMEARLSGPNFAVIAVTPEIQAVTRSSVTEWRWDVEPKREGHHHLHLTLSALIDVDGASTPRAIRTFDKQIKVEVVWTQHVATFLKNNWEWLWAAILVPVAGWLWKRKKGT